MRQRLLLLALALPAAAVPVVAAALPGAEVEAVAQKRKVPVQKSPDLWATINACDTAGRPNTIGIRGSMPGLGRVTTMQMRFQVQYLARSDGKWHDIEDNADSGWRTVGRGRGAVRELGQDFRFLPPSDGGAHRLRGAVRFKWVAKGGKVVERVREVTESGHRSTAGADPAGYSAGVCDISAP